MQRFTDKLQQALEEVSQLLQPSRPAIDPEHPKQARSWPSCPRAPSITITLAVTITVSPPVLLVLLLLAFFFSIAMIATSN